MKHLSTKLLLITIVGVLAISKKQLVKKRSRKEEIQALIDQLEKLHSEKEEVIRLIQKLKDFRDSISEASEDDMLLLQQLMEYTERLELIISNIIKTINETESIIISSLKA